MFDNLDVAANVFIGREPRKLGLLNIVDDKKLHAMVQPYLDQLGANFSSSTAVSRLSLAQRQIVEIAKALSLNARLVILDEPTSSLPIAETEKLLKVIAALKANGIAVMFVSHRLNEVVEACDRVIVLRDGRIVGHLEGDALTHDVMVKLMVGRDLKVAYAAPASERGDVVLSVQKLRTRPSLSPKSASTSTAARFWDLPALSARGEPNSPTRCSASTRPRAARCCWMARPCGSQARPMP